MPKFEKYNHEIEALASAVVQHAERQLASGHSLIDSVKALKSLREQELAEADTAAERHAALAQENEELRQMLHTLVQAIESQTTSAVLPEMADKIADLLQRAGTSTMAAGGDAATAHADQISDSEAPTTEPEEIQSRAAVEAGTESAPSLAESHFEGEDMPTIGREAAAQEDPSKVHVEEVDNPETERDSIESVITRVSEEMQRVAQKSPEASAAADFYLPDASETDSIEELDLDCEEELLDPDEELIDLDENPDDDCIAV